MMTLVRARLNPMAGMPRRILVGGTPPAMTQRHQGCMPMLLVLRGAATFPPSMAPSPPSSLAIRRPSVTSMHQLRQRLPLSCRHAGATARHPRTAAAMAVRLPSNPNMAVWLPSRTCSSSQSSSRGPQMAARVPRGTEELRVVTSTASKGQTVGTLPPQTRSWSLTGQWPCSR